ncbi:amidase domain-containing protein [Thermoanaerobacterium thermosaccharolyticum]|uniref:amidase domain-containing protein n=1 Tax=Thermoanaerobacterium thermosaccharolyticum TaxID=1517 RepID=UPI00123AC92B|nr:amidase domain-containing protein [Thermoanaerobacterium thermosaccharolyticum]KAA5806799.1 CHAP domain-containing protein [Thermoanaerobacterium thermosaccharolyticum]MDK2806368.1 hypothetical protein [Thermoanaerobacterium sp.]MDK2830187.1 hypothetical protein [Clostridium butyricum]
MRKTSLFVTMLIIFNFLLMTSSARASNLTSANYILNANTQIKEYVNALNNSLVDEATQKKMYDFFADSNSNLANYIASRHSIYAEWAKNNNVKFTNISVNINIGNMKYDNGKIFANLYTITTVTYEYLSGKGAGIPNTFKFSEAHDLVLENKNGIYKIIKDNFYDSLRPDLSEDHVNMKVFDYNIDNNDNNTDSNALMNQNSIIPDSYKTVYYQTAAAAAYADKWTDNSGSRGTIHNPNYNYYTNNDCANFVSQCMGDSSAGNLPTDATWYPYSLAWINANSLYNYIVNNRGWLRAYSTSTSYLSSYAKQMKVGDLVFYRWSTSGTTKDHVAIVVGFDSAGNPLVDAHTSNRWHYPWSLYSSNTTFWLVGVNASVTVPQNQ